MRAELLHCRSCSPRCGLHWRYAIALLRLHGVSDTSCRVHYAERQNSTASEPQRQRDRSLVLAIANMTEADVVLTDYFLAAESALFAWLLSRQPSIAPGLRDPLVLFFAATAAGSLAGGTVHGFFLSDISQVGVVLWRAALVSIGVAALSAWMIGARMLFSPPTAQTIQVAATGVFVVYATVIVAVNDSFWVAVANYLPVTVFLMVAFVAAYRSTRQPAMAIGIAGLALTVVAALVQQFHVGLHPRYFNHNALYHAIQAVALFMIFWTARSLIQLI